MGIVYVVNVVKDDISKAAVYGDIKHVNVGYVYPDEISADNYMPVAAHAALSECARKFDPEHDYLLIAGDHLQLVQISALLGRKLERFRVLRWDRQAQGYVPVWIMTRR